MVSPRSPSVCIPGTVFGVQRNGATDGAGAAWLVLRSSSSSSTPSSFFFFFFVFLYLDPRVYFLFLSLAHAHAHGEFFLILSPFLYISYILLFRTRRFSLLLFHFSFALVLVPAVSPPLPAFSPHFLPPTPRYFFSLVFCVIFSSRFFSFNYSRFRPAILCPSLSIQTRSRHFWSLYLCLGFDSRFWNCSFFFSFFWRYF